MLLTNFIIRICGFKEICCNKNCNNVWSFNGHPSSNYTPGHSPGGVSFLYDKMVFAGDTLFQNSIGRTDFRKGSFKDLSNSIKTRLYTLPDDTIVYTGHGPVTTIGDEKKFNSFVRI